MAKPRVDVPSLYERESPCFSDEEIKVLQANKFTYSISKKQLYFTREFKEMAWEQDQMGVAVMTIFRNAGYDPLMVGRSRMDAFMISLRRSVANGVPFTEGRLHKTRFKPPISNYGEMTDRKAFIEMQHEIAYLRQEIEFLKKICALGVEKKRSE